MNILWKTIIWQQLGAAIDMLDNTLRACPDELWHGRLWEDPSERPEYSEFWFIVYHTLFWLDFYLSGTAEGFTPPDRFKRDETDPDGALPKIPYTKDELQTYLDYCRRKCQATIETLTEETAQRSCRFEWIEGELSFLELLLYTMRHIQEHTAQLNLMIGQKVGSAPDWVAKAENKTA